MLFEEVIEKGDKIHWQRFVNYGQNWLGQILTCKGEFETAENLLNSGLFVATQSKEERRIGHYQASYARLEKERGNIDKAQHWGNKALECFSNEGMQENAREMYVLLDDLDN